MFVFSSSALCSSEREESDVRPFTTHRPDLLRTLRTKGVNDVDIFRFCSQAFPRPQSERVDSFPGCQVSRKPGNESNSALRLRTLGLCCITSKSPLFIGGMAMSVTRLCWQGRLLAKALPRSFALQTVRCASSVLKHEGIEVTLTKSPRPKPDPKTLEFGKHFSDHMLLIDWSKDTGWETPKIVPYGNLSLSPALSCLHYATECFEGLKAYHGADGKTRLFRPTENMKRLNRSAMAASLPEFDGDAFLECIKDLIRVDKDWVPKAQDCSLYIRPAFIGTEPYIGVRASHKALLLCITCPVGPYFSSGTFSPVSLYADPQFIRAWPGGVGDSKMGGNYGPTIRVQRVAESMGCSQVLWLLGDDHQLTEVGTMNIFVNWINEDGEPEIATPPLSGTILPGVTRKSLLELGATWGTHKVVERSINMEDVIKAVKENRMKEMFGAGTACVVCPVNRILFQDENIAIPTMDTGAEVAKRFYKELIDIQYGRTEHEWSVVID